MVKGKAIEAIDIAKRDAERLETKLVHAIGMERKAATRVRRAASLLHKWQAARRRVERRIGESEVRRIVNRLSLQEGK